MNPHELENMSAVELSFRFCRALIEKSVALVQDVFVQLESRFHRCTTTVVGSQKFIDEFLDLAGRPEVRALHLDDPLVRCVARLEYLLELAGERARVQTNEATLLQIVASRERGFDLIKALVSPPGQGFTAMQLADRLGITQQNLSPLLRMFHAQGIIDRCRQGKNVFIKLTPQGSELLVFESAMGDQPDKETEKEKVGKVLGEAVLAVVKDISERPLQFDSRSSVLGAAQHGLARVEARYRSGYPEAADLVREMTKHVKQAIGVPSETAPTNF